MTEAKKHWQAMMSLKEASTMAHVTRQALYVAIKKGHLKAQQNSAKHWYVDQKDLDAYRAGKYSRERSTFNGQRVFRKEYKEISIHEGAKFLGVPPQRLYYLTRTGQIPFTRKGSAIVLNFDELKSFFEEKDQMRFA